MMVSTGCLGTYDRSEEDDTRNKFKFFHFARMLEVHEHSNTKELARRSNETLECDPDWKVEIPLSLVIHEDRKDVREREAIRIDFGIEQGSDELIVLKKPAYFWILKNKWHIDTILFRETLIRSAKKPLNFIKNTIDLESTT